VEAINAVQGSSLYPGHHHIDELRDKFPARIEVRRRRRATLALVAV
jgi:hypothetical protein